MAKRRRRSSSIVLPWERSGGLLRRLGLSRARPFLLLLLVIALLVIIGARDRRKTGERVTRASLLVVRKGLDAYRADHEGRCPERLDELVTKGYLAELPNDAWGRPFRLTCPGRKNPFGYDLSSDGPDGEPGGLDRIE